METGWGSGASWFRAARTAWFALVQEAPLTRRERLSAARRSQASNVVLDGAGRCKLVDFGCAALLPPPPPAAAAAAGAAAAAAAGAEADAEEAAAPRATTLCGTPHAMAPEVRDLRDLAQRGA